MRFFKKRKTPEEKPEPVEKTLNVIDETFQRYDKDNSGFLGDEELLTALQHIVGAANVTKEMVADLLVKFDQDGSKSVNLLEFYDMFEQLDEWLEERGIQPGSPHESPGGGPPNDSLEPLAGEQTSAAHANNERVGRDVRELNELRELRALLAAKVEEVTLTRGELETQKALLEQSKVDHKKALERLEAVCDEARAENKRQKQELSAVRCALKDMTLRAQHAEQLLADRKKSDKEAATRHAEAAEGDASTPVQSVAPPVKEILELQQQLQHTQDQYSEEVTALREQVESLRQVRVDAENAAAHANDKQGNNPAMKERVSVLERQLELQRMIQLEHLEELRKTKHLAAKVNFLESELEAIRVRRHMEKDAAQTASAQLTADEDEPTEDIIGDTFKRFDTTGTGLLEKHKLKNAVVSIVGDSCTDEIVDQAMLLLDLDQSNTISLREFYGFFGIVDELLEEADNSMEK